MRWETEISGMHSRERAEKQERRVDLASNNSNEHYRESE